MSKTKEILAELTFNRIANKPAGVDNELSQIIAFYQMPFQKDTKECMRFGFSENLDNSFKKMLTDGCNDYIKEWNRLDEKGEEKMISELKEQLDNYNQFIPEEEAVQTFIILLNVWFLEYVEAIPTDEYNGVVFYWANFNL